MKQAVVRIDTYVYNMYVSMYVYVYVIGVR